MPSAVAPHSVGRYAVYDEFAAGGMGTVHYGRLLGSAGFSRTVVIKQLRRKHAHDPQLVAMLVDEARLAGRVRHPNVVPTLDVVFEGGELIVVLEYVHGESLSRLLAAIADADQLVPWRIVGSIMTDVLHGLHAAHEAKNERGESLELVHRDISPQNVLVGVDGVARVLDFGIAKGMGRLFQTIGQTVKGKLGYMPPEQVSGTVTRRADVFAAAVVLWEALTARRLFTGECDVEILFAVQNGVIEPPSGIVPGLPRALDDVVLRGLERDPAKRFATAREMALAIEACGPLATASEVGAWVESVASPALAARARRIAEIEGAFVPSIDTVSQLLGATPVATPAAVAPSDPEGVAAVSRTRRRAPAVAALIAAVCAVVGVVLLVRQSRSAAVGPAVSVAPAASPAAPPVVGQATATETAAAPPPASATAEAPTDAVAPSSGRTARRPPIAPARSAAPRAPAPAANCDPPYSVDEQGHKHFRAECL